MRKSQSPIANRKSLIALPAFLPSFSSHSIQKGEGKEGKERKGREGEKDVFISFCFISFHCISLHKVVGCCCESQSVLVRSKKERKEGRKKSNKGYVFFFWVCLFVGIFGTLCYVVGSWDLIFMYVCKYVWMWCKHATHNIQHIHPIPGHFARGHRLDRLDRFARSYSFFFPTHGSWSTSFFPDLIWITLRWLIHFFLSSPPLAAL